MKTLANHRLGRAARTLVAGLPFMIAALSSLSLAAEPTGTALQRAAAGTSGGELGTLLRRDLGGKNWHVVPKDGAIPDGELLVGIPGAYVNSPNHAVQVALLADLDHNSPYPIREAAVQLSPPAGTDMAFSLERGRIDIRNQKSSGPATIRVTVRKASWEIVLEEPGTRLAMELFGRWPRGVPFHKNPGPMDEPTANLVFLVLKGNITVKHGGFEFAMQAPPGPALLEWDSLSGQDDSPQRLEKLPPWADATDEQSVQAKVKRLMLERFRKAMVAKSLDTALADFMNSINPLDRILAVNVMAALDKIPELGKAMRESKHLDVNEAGILAMRAWIGREPGQDQKLYNALIEVANYKPVHAETVLQLLHSYSDTELALPETYQTLIDYLNHEQLAIRSLAHWHLVRLVPSGLLNLYNPNASAESRAAAVEKWRKLVPPGKVPSRRAPGGNK